ncbi:MAG: PIN domain-containing protein [Crocinitomicaceae bacterium]|nr:PIN domain-containing protein [Crocinitomicaceae bacterium]
MSRYLLDTNIVIFIISGNKELTKEIKEITQDFSNQLYTSSVVIAEIIQLHRLKKIQSKKYKTSLEILEAIEKEYFIEILPFTKQHTKTLAKLSIAQGHNDPFDHAIIAHSITDKLTLISSDKKFENYVSQKLKFVFNKR